MADAYVADTAPPIAEGLTLEAGFEARPVTGWTLHQIDLFGETGFPEGAIPIAPGRAWLIDAEPPELDAETGAVVELSDSRVRLALSGPLTVPVLARCLPIDLRPRAFPEGAGKTAPIHEVAVFIHRTGPESFELYLPAGYARSLWEWIVEAAHNAARVA